MAAAAGEPPAGAKGGGDPLLAVAQAACRLPGVVIARGQSFVAWVRVGRFSLSLSSSSSSILIIS